jgi:hypothetical protein
MLSYNLKIMFPEAKKNYPLPIKQQVKVTKNKSML